MAKRKGGYFKLGYIACVILALIPITNIIFGIVTRIERGNIVGAILNFFIAPLFYIVDLITIIFSRKISFLA